MALDIEYISKKTGIPVDKVESAMFWIVDHLMENISDDAINCGAYYNLQANGDKNMIESYKAILWAQYEEIDGQKPQSPGPWVTVDLINGIGVHKERPYRNG